MAGFRRALQVLLVCVFTAMLGLGIISPILPLYARDLGATLVQIGLLSSAWSMSRLIFTAPIGRFSDRSSKKKIIAAGLLVYAVVSLLYVLAWDFTSLVSIRFLHGLGSAMSMPIAFAYAAELVPEGEEGRYMGSMNLAMFAGMGLGPLIGGSLTDFFSMSVPFYVMGAFTGLSLVLTMVFLPEDAQRRVRVDRPRSSYGEIMSNRLLRAAFVYRAVGALGRGCIMSFLSMYMSNSPDTGGLGIPIIITGMVLSFGQISAALLQQPFGVLADRYNKIYLTLLGGLLGAFGLSLFPLANDSWSVMAARLVFSVGSATGMPALTAIVAIEGKDMGLGTTMSVLQIAMSLGMIAGPLLFGILGDIFGLRPIFYFGGLITIAGTIAFYVLQKL